MRVAVVGPRGSDTFAENVADTLGRMGHEVLELGPRPRYETTSPRMMMARARAKAVVRAATERRPGLAAWTQRDWIAEVQDRRPQLLVSVDRTLSKEVVRAAKASGAKTALWFPDHVSNMGRHDMFLSGYDRVYLTNPILTTRLQKIYGLPVAYLPEACNSRWHVPLTQYGTSGEIVLAGNVHPTRAVLLDRLARDGVPLRIYGAPIADWVGFPSLRRHHTGEFVVRERKADVFRSARAVLNNLHPAEFGGTNCRLFEAAGCGAVVLSEQREGLDDLFRIGEEVLTFEDYEGLLTIIRQLLSNDAVGRPIANAATARALADHTYETRLQAIFEDLELA